MRLTPERRIELADPDKWTAQDSLDALETIDALTAKLASARGREQAIEAAAYRKAAELCKNTLLHTLDPGNRIRDGILALISLSAQSALDEMIADREKRARETALREVLEIVRVYRGSLGDLPRGEIMKRITAILDAPGSPSPRLYTEAEVTERVRTLVASFRALGHFYEEKLDRSLEDTLPTPGSVAIQCAEKLEAALGKQEEGR